ncbi:hypothetical protein [Cereibacter sphaeroides]|uniref:hypothetical protein n=1 Tax=Cereibacter sphaeroides TaxID=1063 RepID=UPI0015FB7B49|nr:hypothetical protein [Cereibacter sphaeroides]
MVLFTFTAFHAAVPWQVVTLAIAGLGLGGIMSVSSTAIMINAPEENAGMAGALEGIFYELGGTLGVAVMGSVIASIYTRTFAPPAEARLPASAWDSLDQTLIVASTLATDLAGQVDAAGKLAFSGGVVTTLTAASLLSVTLFAVMALHARNKPAGSEPASTRRDQTGIGR